MCELKNRNNKILSVCCGGIVNQAIIVNITALMYVAFMQLYNFSYIQMAMLTAVGFLAQLGADILLLAIIDKIDKNKMAKLSCICSGIGLIFYGCIPLIFHGIGIYIGILFATMIFAFSGGFLEIILSSIADNISTTFGGICLLHTVYAWSFAGLSILFLGYFYLFDFINWNYILFLLAVVPFVIFFLLDTIKEDNIMSTVKQTEVQQMDIDFDSMENIVTNRQKNSKLYLLSFYILAFLAVFFGYGAEIIVSQWVSIYTSILLQNELLSMIGPIFFAICLGIGGLLYISILQKKQKIPLSFFLIACVCASLLFFLAGIIPIAWLALLCLISSGLFVGILSPSAITYASKSKIFLGGWLFALLAISQDVSATILPALFSIVATQSIYQALFISAPIPLFAGILFTILKARKKNKKF